MQVFYATTLGLIKISICLFLARIFSAANNFRKWAYAVIAFIAAWSIMVILTAFVLCQPVAYNWDDTIPGGKCADQPAAFLAIGILDLVVDLMVLVLPLPMIWNLQLPMTNKIALFAIFGVGILYVSRFPCHRSDANGLCSTMVISCLRIYALHTVSYMDITYTAAYPVLWSFTEPAIGISVASAPLLRPLFKGKMFGSLFGTRKGSRGTGKPSKHSGDSSFRRLDEEHGLSDMEPNTITISGGRPRRGSLSDESLEGLATDTTGITVKHELRMQRV